MTYRIAFTGHLPNHLTPAEGATAKAQLWGFLERMRQEHPDLRALVGGALGIDETARRLCEKLTIAYDLCLPAAGYVYYWVRAGLRDQYYEMLAEAQRGDNRLIHVVPSPCRWNYTHNFTRNQYLVDNSDLLCAIFKGKVPEDVMGKQGGGTLDTLERALKAGRPYAHFDPRWP
jgi:hypothetical protein